MQSTASQERSRLEESPQVRIYNRYFYKKENQQQLLQELSQREAKQTANLPKITPSSYAILSKKMLAELQQHISSLIDAEEQVSYETVQQLVRIYVNSPSMSKAESNAAHDERQEEKQLSEQLYLLLCRYNLENEPTVEDLFSVLRVLLDPYRHTISEELSLLGGLPSFGNIEKDRQNFLEANPDCRDETLPIGQLLQIWRKLRLKNTSFDKQKESTGLSDYAQSSFKPTISKKSEQLAAKKYSQLKEQLEIAHSASNRRIDRHEVLYNTKLNRDVPKLNVETDGECTFKPEINRNFTSRHDPSQSIVERLYHVPQRKGRNYREAEEEKELKQCTFKPKLISPGRVSTASTSRPKPVKNFDKSVYHMALARSRKQQLQQAYNNLGKVQSRSTLKGVPPSMLQKEPKVILEIKVDETRVEKIKLYGGEDPRVVANRFVRKNDLSEEMIEVVEDLIREYSEKYME